MTFSALGISLGPEEKLNSECDEHSAPQWEQLGCAAA
jgi:hypothetical protein